MLKSQENQIKLAMEEIEKQHDENLKHHARYFKCEVTKLRGVAKARHEIFIKKVKKLEESVSLKVVELKSEITKEVAKLEQAYSTLHGKVDVISDVVAKLVEYNTSYSTKLDAKTEQDSKVFENMEEFMSSLKESLSKLHLSQQYYVSGINLKDDFIYWIEYQGGA
ncbi:unnamed protein product [Lactuca virosa]|uniref:Uncharacterized protein n=1 Tax=Lactuca virosa TaxID=75947 RepID=A0AAU9PBU9_9ASTR|nr:unnamed protein product [Lactuca virosa]